MVIDHATRQVSVLFEDRTEVSIQGPEWPDSPFAVSGLRPKERIGSFRIINSEEIITVELPSGDPQTDLADRQVVYLDQNMWSLIARVEYSPDKCTPTQVEDVHWLLSLVQAQKVVLPISAGTVHETTHWTDDRGRRQLGLTYLKHSRGWQLQEPLLVRRMELTRALRGEEFIDPAPGNVWTLSGFALMADRISPRVSHLSAGSTVGENDPLVLAFQAVEALATFAALVLEDSPLKRSDQVAWVQRFEDFRAWLATQPTEPNLLRTRTLGFFIGDLLKEIFNAGAMAGLTLDEVGEWLSHLESMKQIEPAPMLGLIREVFHHKFRNRNMRWEPNDLHDLWYFVGAAGYATAVVGERKFANLTRQAQASLGRPESAFRNLADLRASGLLT